MKPPSLKDTVLGHPLVALPVMGLCGLLLYRCYLDLDYWPLGVAALFLMNAVADASGVRVKFLSWQRAWDAMGGVSSNRHPGVAGNLMLIMMLGSMMAYMAAHLDVANYRMGLALMVAIGLGGSALLLVKRVRQQRALAPSAATANVSICVNAPILPVPSLAQAFAALPEHCLALR